MGRSPRAALRRAIRRLVAGFAAPDSRLRRAVPRQLKPALRAVRRRLPDRAAAVIDDAAGTRSNLPLPPLPPVPTTPVRLLVAPANFAGQGDAWARAAATHLDGVGSVSMMKDNTFGFPVDQEVTSELYGDRAWQLRQRSWVIDSFTHVLVEAERPPFGTLYGPTAAGDIAQLRGAGVTVATICHGSDVRIPSVHHARFPHSPFRDPDDRTTRILEARAQGNTKYLASFDGAKFVSTPDCLDWVPTAQWCPVIVDIDSWTTSEPPFERATPKVVHIPSNGPLKGSDLIDPIMRELAGAGLIDYVSARGLPHAELRELYRDADIILDQFVLGLYGVAAVEGMAAGRPVVAFVGDTVRARVRDATGLEVPIVEADPDTVKDVVLGLVSDRDEARRIGAAGPAFARSVHDGRFSATVLASFLGRGSR